MSWIGCADWCGDEADCGSHDVLGKVYVKTRHVVVFLGLDVKRFARPGVGESVPCVQTRHKSGDRGVRIRARNVMISA
jgi:hypothetical protein